MHNTKSLKKNTAHFIFAEAENAEQSIRKRYNQQRMAYLMRNKLNIKKRRQLVANGANRKQIYTKTPHLDRKLRACFPRGKAFDKVYDQTWPLLMRDSF